MTIFIDMDQTIVDFSTPFYNKAKETINGDLDTSFSEMKESNRWDIQSVLFGSNKDKEAITDMIFSSPGFWLNMKPYAGAIEAVQEISRSNKVYLVTAPWHKSVNCYIEKYYWVLNNLPEFDISKLLYIKDKHLLKGDIIIDDKPKYLEYNSCKYSIAFKHEYNKDVEVNFRSDDWNEIKDYIKGL